MKVNTGNSKLMALNGEEGLECAILGDGMQLEHVLEFKYLGCVLDESGTDAAECRRKAVSGMRFGGPNRFLVNARGLPLECARVLHKTLLVPVFMYGSEAMIWKEEERSRIRVVQIDKIRIMLGVRMMDRVLNAWIREFCRVVKGVDERIEEDVRRLFSHMERMENDRIAKRLYVGECAGSCTVGQVWKEKVD